MGIKIDPKDDDPIRADQPKYLIKGVTIGFVPQDIVDKCNSEEKVSRNELFSTDKYAL